MNQRAGDRPWAEWLLIGAVALWYAGVPPLAAAVLALIPGAREGTWRQALASTAIGAVQLGGLLVAFGLVRLGSAGPGVAGRWPRFTRVCLLLLLSALWSLLDSLLGHLLADGPNWLALVRLSAGIPALLILGGWLLKRVCRCTWSEAWREMGLTRSGSLGWGLAAAALVLWPWLLVGSLGDSAECAAIVLQSLADGLLTEWLWRGLALGLLCSATRARWSAVLLGGALYLGYALGRLALSGDPSALWETATAFALALLVSELWARPGPGKHGVWGAVAFHVLYLAFPRLFADPRSEFELAHWAARAAMPVFAAGLALVLVAGRLLWSRLFAPLPGSRLRSALVAAIAWSGALGVYLIGGAPGFHNDGYLIILRQQTSLAGQYSQPENRSTLYQVLVETAETSQAPIRAQLDRMGLPYRPYYLVNMIRVDGTTHGIKTFAAQPEVSQVIRNPNVREYPVRWPLPYGVVEPEQVGVPWGISALHTEQVWQMGITGAGIVVAGQDSGIDWQHPELKDSYRGWDGSQADHDRNWHDAWDATRVPFDDDSHGTHTLGTVVGNSVGMAPDAQWIGCRNMRHGIGNPGSYVECMEFFFAPYPLGGDPFHDGAPDLAPQVVNNSWGCPPEEGCVVPEPMHTAVEVLRAAGIMMVVSAGNEGPACQTVWLPASDDAVLAVGASDQAGQATSYSSRGPAASGLLKPDLVAPGVNVVSSVPGGGYGSSEGTSMAGPHVAGLVALLWSANPQLIGQIQQTEQIIGLTARGHPVPALCVPGTQECACGQTEPELVPNNVYGYGIVDALSAVREALKLRGG